MDGTAPLNSNSFNSVNLTSLPSCAWCFSGTYGVPHFVPRGPNPTFEIWIVQVCIFEMRNSCPTGSWIPRRYNIYIYIYRYNVYVYTSRHIWSVCIQDIYIESMYAYILSISMICNVCHTSFTLQNRTQGPTATSQQLWFRTTAASTAIR